MNNRQKGFIAIVVGGILLFSVIGPFLFQVLIALLGLMLINYGLRLRGKPPLGYLVFSWIDQFKV